MPHGVEVVGEYGVGVAQGVEQRLRVLRYQPLGIILGWWGRGLEGVSGGGGKRKICKPGMLPPKPPPLRQIYREALYAPKNLICIEEEKNFKVKSLVPFHFVVKLIR